MTSLSAWFGGAVRVARAPLVVLGVYAVTLLLTVPLGVMLHDTLSRSGAAVDADWIDETSRETTGLAHTLVPEMIGAAAPLDHLSAILDGRRPPQIVLMTVAVFFVCWTIMWGGLIERLSRNAGIGPGGFARASLRSSGALLVLGAGGLIAYAIVFAILHGVLLGPVYAWLTSGQLERTAFAWRAALSAVTVVVLVGISQVVDYARIAVVVDQVSVGDALRRGLAVVRRRPLAVAGVVVLNGLLLAGLLVAYGAVEFLPGGAEPTLVRILLLGQGLILGRLVIRLVLAASQIELRSIA